MFTGVLAVSLELRILSSFEALGTKFLFNPLSTSPQKRSNTLKQLVDISQGIVCVCLTTCGVST